ncbi:MAG: SUMF1/EgtB/PvdO family nonheme iron enzyme, partial [Bacteroidetes bacterium]|nr:SUMF1/EgtB/PvdO family nonheme iron enzyme [Bacteroidota bacterium]
MNNHKTIIQTVIRLIHRKVILSLCFSVSMLLINGCGTIELLTSIDNPSDASQYKENIYISPFEVSVRDWITYMTYTQLRESTSSLDFFGKDVLLLGEHIADLEPMLPDPKVQGWCSYVINSFLRKDNEMVSMYFLDHCTSKESSVYLPKSAHDSIIKYKLLDVPMVGITYEQAQQYIAYKQEASNACDLAPKKNVKKYRYECFLPTPAQFDSIQTIMDSVITGKCNLFNFNHIPCTDCRWAKKTKDHPVLKKNGSEPVYIWSYMPDDWGLWNIKGNVAEMTSIKGIAKGGSCNHPASEAYDN